MRPRWKIFRSLFAVSLIGFILTTLSKAQEDGSRVPDQFLLPARVSRVALVIGAENYEKLDHVENALNDAAAVVKALDQVGFNFIRFLPDPRDDNEIFDYVEELAQRSGDAGEPAITLFFFAGHGFQDQAFPYIVPIAATNDHLVRDSVSVADIMQKLAVHRAGLAIFLLDSCRTGVGSSGTGATPDGSSGAQFSFSAPPAPRGAILGLATEFGYPARSAVHERDPNSPYTTGLVTYIPHKALPLSVMLEKVKTFVQVYTRDKQSAVVVKNANESGFFFVPTQSENDVDSLAWKAVLKTNRADCAQWYIDSHPGSSFLKAALAWKASPHNDANDGANLCPDQ